MARLRVIGLMSGTSFDGIDAAAAEIELVERTLRVRPLGMITDHYPDEVRQLLRAALPPGRIELAQVNRLTTEIGRSFAALAERAVATLCAGRADLVASHGQTVHHWVEDGAARGSLQLGQPAWIAARTGLPVVSDFRSADVAAGGQGAPLVALFDGWWLRSPAFAELGARPAALNLGGIANLTVATDPPVAFDSGPANAWLDAIMQRDGGADFDDGGQTAAAGRVREALLADLAADPYYARRPPKSTGKEHFNLARLDAAVAAHRPIALPDLMATLVELTARTVAEAAADQGVTGLVVSGGGARNPVLMGRIAALSRPAPVRSSEAYGLPVSAKEALAFAVLGWLTAHHLPGAVPSTTGASRASVLGSITPGQAPLSVAPLSALPDRLELLAA
ncbi:anhydro-N-acetylmuramic acid kinase [Naumannella huperziae]